MATTSAYVHRIKSRARAARREAAGKTVPCDRCREGLVRGWLEGEAVCAGCRARDDKRRASRCRVAECTPPATVDPEREDRIARMAERAGRKEPLRRGWREGERPSLS